MQSSILTGKMPAEHGIVGNGWYFRDLGEVFLWRQHNRLVQAEKVWESARATTPDYTAANVGWWYAMGGTTDITVTPDSAIAGPFANGSALGDVLNPVIIWAQLQFPVHLLVGSAVQMFGTAAILALWSGFWCALYRMDRARFGLRGREGRCAALVFSCLLALSLFEPDFGSYLRHLAPMAPAVLCMVLRGGELRVPNRPARH